MVALALILVSFYIIVMSSLQPVSHCIRVYAVPSAMLTRCSIHQAHPLVPAGEFCCLKATHSSHRLESVDCTFYFSRCEIDVMVSHVT